jgi:hypothetical protein
MQPLFLTLRQYIAIKIIGYLIYAQNVQDDPQAN